MKSGHLSQHFAAVGAKRLTTVEINSARSHQHEFQGIQTFRTFLGDAKRRLRSKILYMSDEDQPVEVEADLTWYDARQNQPGRTPEYRLYYPQSAATVVRLAAEGDLLVVALTRQGELLVVIAPSGSTTDGQLCWLFGLEKEISESLAKQLDAPENDRELSISAETILAAIGISAERHDESFLDQMLHNFQNRFPTTFEFSAYSRSTLAEVSVRDDPDTALLQFMEREELLFKTLERHFVSVWLQRGRVEPDDLISFSLSLHQRRRARAGKALENHLAAIFEEWPVKFSRGQVTENNNRPDFIFPDIVAYRDLGFPAHRLTMLAAKQTCKDRWRQILQEAARIDIKHLCTLEPSISVAQTDQMKDAQVQLIVPAALHVSYSGEQQSWLLNLRQFLDLVSARQGSH